MKGLFKISVNQGKYEKRQKMYVPMEIKYTNDNIKNRFCISLLQGLNHPSIYSSIHPFTFHGALQVTGP